MKQSESSEDQTPSRQVQQPTDTGSPQMGAVNSRERRARTNHTWQQMQYMGGPPELSKSDGATDGGAAGNDPTDGKA